MSCDLPTGAVACAPRLDVGHQPMAQRHINAAATSLDAWSHATSTPGEPNLTDGFVRSLCAPQYSRTFVQGCACSTGIAGGGCCPGGATGVALHAHNAAHALMGLVGGTLGALGLYGGIRVMANSRDAHKQLTLVQHSVAPRIESLALLEAQSGAAQLPRERVSRALQAQKLWAQALQTSTHEQRFNFWVPGVLQTLAAAGAVMVAAGHMGLAVAAPWLSASLGVLAPALFASYGLLLAGKHIVGMPCALAPKTDAAAPDADAASQAFDAQTHAYAQARRQHMTRAAWAWGLVGATGTLGTLVTCGVWVMPIGSGALLAASLGAAGFAMWQNSQTRFVPHLPISSHVEPRALGARPGRIETARALAAQDNAIEAATTGLVAQAPWFVVTAHRIERALRPQCGPSANQVLARFVQRTRAPRTAEKAAGQTRLLLDAARVWCREEQALMRARSAADRIALQAELASLKKLLQPSCKHKGARMAGILEAQGAQARALTQAARFVRDEAESLEEMRPRLSVLAQLEINLDAMQSQDLKHLADADMHTPGPAQTWLWTRLMLLALSNTLGDAVDRDVILQNPDIFSQLASPDALPIHNVFVMPHKVDAFARAIAPRIDGAFVHAFCNPRRIEAELDYVFELDLAARTQPATANTAPVCTGESCCR